MKEDRKAALKRQIEEAFADAPGPGADICVPDRPERDAVAAAFGGSSWKGMPLDAMSKDHAVAEGLEVMTTCAFRFYLPGYLLLSLDSPKRFEHLRLLVCRFLRWELGPYKYHAEGMPARELEFHEAARRRREERMRLLSPAQAKAVSDFLSYIEWIVEERRTSLKRQIEEAFADVPSPGSDPRELVENYSEFQKSDGMFTADAFAGRHWKDMPIEAITDNAIVADGILQMAPQAFLFYLPGFMITTLDRPNCFWEGEGTLIFTLCPREPHDYDPSMNPDRVKYARAVDEAIAKDYKEKMSLLSPVQRKAVIDFLTYLREVEGSGDPSINRAIDYISELGQSASDNPLRP